MGNQHGKEGRAYGRRIDWDNAEKPYPPGKPYLVPDGDEQSDFITIRWAPPISDGGAPILGYLVEHRRTGSPHWLRAIPYLATDTVLTLTGLEPGWRYQFRVSAENDVGRSPPGEVSEVLTVTSQRTAATSPHFNVELQDTIALENEKVEFTVHVVAIPQAKIAWYKDGFEVFSSRRMKILTENDQSTFIIHQAALEDEGEIKCTATNRAGHSVTKAILKLEAPPRIRLPRQYEDGLLFEKGELVRLKVSTAGRPAPFITWYHNGELLENNEKYEITDADRSSCLRISEAHREDRGEYMVKGVNKIGEDVASFLVTVTDRPQPPGKAKVAMALGRSVTLSWTCPEDDGGCRIGSYTVEYFRVGWNMWLKAVTCRQLTTVLTDLIEGSEYKFRVKAENPYGMSDPGEESEVVFIPDPKRGILTPSQRVGSRDIDLWLNGLEADGGETKDADRKLEKRKLLEENARILLDTPFPVLVSQENAVQKPPRRTQHGETGKRQLEKTGEEPEDGPPPVPKRRHRGEHPKRTPSPMLTEEVREQKTTAEAEGQLQAPREEDPAMFHGSSELMLVLLPEERTKDGEPGGRRRSEMEMSLVGTGVAPPMSLSAPELGSGDPIELPGMREAVSSSELLHERAMARLYQDSIEEEAQKVLKRRYSGDRRSLERRSSLKEGTLPERRHSFRESLPQDVIAERAEPVAEERRSLIPIPKKRSPERMSSVERERMEFALVRERIRAKNEQSRREKSPPPRPSSTGSQSVGSDRADEECVEEEEEDYLEDEEEDEEELDAEMERPGRREQKSAPFAEEEDDDVCHPVTSRIVLPRLQISLPPVIVETAEPSFQVGEEPPEPAPPTLIPPKKGKKRAAKFLKKLGLKKEKKVPEIIVDDSSSRGCPSPLPKPILKNMVKKKKAERSREQLSASCDDTSDDGLAPRKKKQVRISEPGKEASPAKAKDGRQEPSEEELAKRVLICHYSDIVREFGHGKKPAPRQCLSCEELKAVAGRETGRTTAESSPMPAQEKGEPAESKAEGEGDVEQLQQPERGQQEKEPQQKEEEVPGRLGKSAQRIHSSISHLMDVSLFLIACWLYLFENELYAVPVLCLVAWRQMNEALQRRTTALKRLFARNADETR